MSPSPDQQLPGPEPESGLSVERWDEIILELDVITRALTSIDARLESIDELLPT